ncbi:unnamed protein product [Mytilus coruscus]|uniref:Reverse transcriptase domain-containing protein n=1 Tax=Mytilus coruscus TaxID=42192 RepID=A0A6J8EBD8_MYTCO|nr:unnamed protein product [Mytilus coruscus]
MHLSFPNGCSVNDFVNPNETSVKYISFDEVIDMVSSLGKGARLGVQDIKSAFRLLPISPGDFDLLGIYFDGNFYVDKSLPFGCSIACALFEKISTFLHRLVVSSAAVAPNTAKVYQQALRSFKDFRALFPFEDLWPVPLHHISNYIAYMSFTGTAASTVKSYISGLSFSVRLKIILTALMLLLSESYSKE